MEIKLATYNDCTGCGACKASCNRDAIYFDYDRNGFLRPIIDNDKCIGCGLCAKNCPVLNREKIKYNDPFKYTCFTAWTKDDELCLKCTSGGVATQLAIDFIQIPQSIYYGAAISSNNSCQHIGCVCLEDIKKTIGTKYIQSDASKAMSDAKKRILEGWRVLFSGTPCQIAAIYSLIPNRYWDKLYTIELICHGTPSKKVADYNVNYYGCKEMVAYRTKRLGWCKLDGKKVVFAQSLIDANGNIMYTPVDNFFHKSFSTIVNPSCSKCFFSQPLRCADIVLGDQWGLINKYPERSNIGASSVIVTSTKGYKLFVSTKNLYYEENLMSSINAPSFFKPFRKLTYPLISRYFFVFEIICNKRIMYDLMTLNWRNTWMLIPIKIAENMYSYFRRNDLKNKIIYYRNLFNWK